MRSPKVSVIIPAYNGADYLGEAIQSVLNQTYPHFELVVVDDASPDNTGEVVKGFRDPRVKYIRHDQNKGADAARNTGIRACAGELISFLDQDDKFHAQKLQVHVNFLEAHPDVGLTYDSHFELNYSSDTIREIRRPPRSVTMADLVLGFPIPPSNMIIRRDWLFQIGLLDETHDFHGGEIIVLSRLVLSGCKFAFVHRALNYRRHHSGRVYRDIAGNCKSELYAQDKILSDPRCPPEISALRDQAFMNTYLVWYYYAFKQGETALGQEFLRKAVHLDPSILKGNPCRVVRDIVEHSTADETEDHELVLKEILAQLPPEMARLSEQYPWAVAQGYLAKGTRATMWNRPADGGRYFAQAQSHGAQIDERYLRKLTDDLINYEIEFGAEAVQGILGELTPHLERIAGRKTTRWLKGSYHINQAFHSYQVGEYSRVPGSILGAILNNPNYLANRGVLSILFRSALGVRQVRSIPNHS